MIEKKYVDAFLRGLLESDDPYQRTASKVLSNNYNGLLEKIETLESLLEILFFEYLKKEE